MNLDDIFSLIQAREEQFTPVGGYDLAPYTDDNVIYIDNKSIGDISGQIVISGEAESQYIVFECDRYEDGIDLTTKTLQIHYERPDGQGDNSPAVNVAASDTLLRFGWIVPAAATAQDGPLKVMPFWRGTAPNGKNYILKSLYASLKINDGLAIDGGIAEPPSDWYEQFSRQMDTYLEQAKGQALQASGSATSAKQYAEMAETSLTEVKAQAELGINAIKQAENEAITNISSLPKVKNHIITFENTQSGGLDGKR